MHANGTTSEAKTDNPGKVAVYLVLAHGDPTLFRRLINALDEESVSFIVHVDAKSDIGSFKAQQPARDNVIYIDDNRVKVFWGGYSMVEATLRLMEVALERVPDFRYALLLSGVHYPIKSNQYILEMLERADQQYLQYAKVSEVGCTFKTDAYCLYDLALFNPRSSIFASRILNKLAKAPGKMINTFLKKAVPLVVKKRPKPKIEVYTGANWWALTKPCIQYVLNYVDDNPGYVSCFRHAVQPDETFFHTIVCNSPFDLFNRDVTLASLAGGGRRNGKYDQLRGLSLTFTKCGPDGAPKTLDESDFPDLSKECNYFVYPQLFARKFDALISRNLLALLDDFRAL